MSYFKAKRHQIRFWLELCRNPAGELTARWGAYSAPRPLARFKKKGGEEGRERIQGDKGEESSVREGRGR